jgi:hypothetical protein
LHTFWVVGEEDGKKGGWVVLKFPPNHPSYLSELNRVFNNQHTQNLLVQFYYREEVADHPGQGPIIADELSFDVVSLGAAKLPLW